VERLETDLNDRTLRFDGVSIVDPIDLASALTRGILPSELRVRGTSEDVQAFNLQVAEADHLRQAIKEPINIDMAWRLPDEYKGIDLFEYISEALIARLDTFGYTDVQREQAIERIVAELDEIKLRGMTEFTKTIIYVLDTFRKKDIVWGVGRGSSCASYVLFILGLHVVDSIKFDVPMTEFFHD
jgi:DNA polymerase III alpha subunit